MSTALRRKLSFEVAQVRVQLPQQRAQTTRTFCLYSWLSPVEHVPYCSTHYCLFRNIPDAVYRSGCTPTASPSPAGSLKPSPLLIRSTTNSIMATHILPNTASNSPTRPPSSYSVGSTIRRVTPSPDSLSEALSKGYATHSTPHRRVNTQSTKDLGHNSVHETALWSGGKSPAGNPRNTRIGSCANRTPCLNDTRSQ